ncbi:MAPEG family protein [Pseudomonas sp. DSP3-2-2]|uniref:MAPEG family protein n=1 Tax=unclassified Pseudomonas TaxID=196821 RepID=UPI003CE699A3
MTVAFWCVLIAIFLPVVCASIAKFSSGKFNSKHNHNPRNFLNNLEGLPARAHAAQLNSFEILPGFIAAVVIAHIAGNAQLVTIDVVAVLFITSRLLYIIFYLADLAALRSLAWTIGMALIVSLFVASATPMPA